MVCVCGEEFYQRSILKDSKHLVQGKLSPVDNLCSWKPKPEDKYHNHRRQQKHTVKGAGDSETGRLPMSKFLCCLCYCTEGQGVRLLDHRTSRTVLQRLKHNLFGSPKQDQCHSAPETQPGPERSAMLSITLSLYAPWSRASILVHQHSEDVSSQYNRP